MNIVSSPDFRSSLKDLTKSKYLGIYGTVEREAKLFFSEYRDFDQVWQKNYMLFENGDVRVNKVRLENPLQNSGKSGGYRMIILCDRRTKTIALLYIFPKTGPYGMSNINLEFSKKLVRNYSKAKSTKSLETVSLKH